MESLRKEDLSLHFYLENYVLSCFNETEYNIPLTKNISQGPNVYEAQSEMVPLPTSEGRGWNYLEKTTSSGFQYDAEQTSRVIVYESNNDIISSSNYIIDYLDGRIITSGPSIVPDHVTYDYNYVALVNEWSIVESSELPIVVVDVSRTIKTGFQLGGGKFVSRSAFLHIFASNTAERDDIAESLYNGLYLKSCAYQDFPKGTPLDWNGTWNDNYEYATIDGSSSLRFDNVISENIVSPLVGITGRDYTQLTDLYNKFRNRISFNLIHWEEA